jgi:hypothetical protein
MGSWFWASVCYKYPMMKMLWKTNKRINYIFFASAIYMLSSFESQSISSLALHTVLHGVSLQYANAADCFGEYAGTIGV